jgi:hypothetical protein
VDLWHGRVFGKRLIQINGTEAHLSRKVLDDGAVLRCRSPLARLRGLSAHAHAGSQHLIEVEGRRLWVVIAPKGFSGFTYHLLSDKSAQAEGIGRPKVRTAGDARARAWVTRLRDDACTGGGAGRQRICWPGYRPEPGHPLLSHAHHRRGRA